MAKTIAPQKLTFHGNGDIYRWENVVEGDTMLALSVAAGQDQITIQAYGTFGGATLAIHGSVAGSQFNIVDDAYGQAMSYTAASGLKPVGPNLTGIKPIVTGGSSADIDVDMLVTRKNY